MTSSSGPRLNLDFLVGVSTNVAALLMTLVDLSDDIENISHAHGLCLLVATKACRVLHAIRSNAPTQEVSSNLSCIPRGLVTAWNAISNATPALSLALGALLASSIDAMDKYVLGSEHGAVLLSLNELLELIHEADLFQGRSRMHLFISSKNLRLFLVLAATIIAAWETLRKESFHFGTHNSVFLLAIVKVLRRFGRRRMLNFLRHIGVLRGELKKKPTMKNERDKVH